MPVCPIYPSGAGAAVYRRERHLSPLLSVIEFDGAASTMGYGQLRDSLIEVRHSGATAKLVQRFSNNYHGEVAVIANIRDIRLANIVYIEYTVYYNISYTPCLCVCSISQPE